MYKMITEFLDLENINKTMLTQLIEKIVIDENRNVEIKYRFNKPF